MGLRTYELTLLLALGCREKGGRRVNSGKVRLLLRPLLILHALGGAKYGSGDCCCVYPCWYPCIWHQPRTNMIQRVCKRGRIRKDKADDDRSEDVKMWVRQKKVREKAHGKAEKEAVYTQDILRNERCTPPVGEDERRGMDSQSIRPYNGHWAWNESIEEAKYS